MVGSSQANLFAAISAGISALWGPLHGGANQQVIEMLERIAAVRRFEARTLEIAKRLFVFGDTPKRLSVEFGVNLARVYAIRSEIEAAADELALPEGWEEVTLAGPKAVMAKVRAVFEAEMVKAATSDASKK